jgi:type VI secretion system protein ImpK
VLVPPFALADDQTTQFPSRRFTRFVTALPQPTALIRPSDEFDGSDGGVGGDSRSSVPTEGSSREAPTYHPRPFTAWPTARERSADSLWSRARTRIARLFGRGERNNGHAPESELVEPVAPPDDFRFPWSDDERFSLDSAPASSNTTGRPEEPPLLHDPFETVDEALPVFDEGVRAVPAVEGSATSEDERIVEADTDPVPEPPTEPPTTLEVERPGFFARLFGRAEEPPTEEERVRVSQEVNPAFLVTKFRAFYNEVLHRKHQGTAITAGFATALLTHDEATTESPDQAAQALSARLQQMLELQQAEATWTGGETGARYHDAQYAMAVLADETLSTIDWQGKSAWPQYSLEQKLFKTSAADLEFFKRVDRLFKEGLPTPASRDLARVYLLTLAAGFRGKYGMFGLTRALHEYRQRLFEYIHGGDALLLYDEHRAIFPDALSRTIPGRATARVSGAQRWNVVLAVIVVAYTVIAHLAWNRASSELRDVTARVEATSSQGAR